MVVNTGKNKGSFKRLKGDDHVKHRRKQADPGRNQGNELYNGHIFVCFCMVIGPDCIGAFKLLKKRLESQSLQE